VIAILVVGGVVFLVMRNRRRTQSDVE
jgi:hypothetical protein